MQSGPWLTPIYSSGDPSGTGAAFDGRPQHPDRVGSAYPGTQNAGQWFLASGFACPGGNSNAGLNVANPPIRRFGTSGVGILGGPGTVNWDFGLAKSLSLTERAKLRFEISLVNVMNHLNLGDPDLLVTDLNIPSNGLCGFGYITSAQGLFQFAAARQGQASMRIDF